MERRVLLDLYRFLEDYDLPFEDDGASYLVLSDKIFIFFYQSSLHPVQVRAIKRAFGPLEATGDPPDIKLAGSVFLDCGTEVKIELGDAFKCTNTGYTERPLNEEEIKANQADIQRAEASLERLRGKVTVKETDWTCEPVEVKSDG